MTVFPQEPKLAAPINIGGRQMRRLAESHATHVPMGLGWSLEVVISSGYVTDGASVSSAEEFLKDTKLRKKAEKFIGEKFPEKEFRIVYDWLVGGQWDMPRLLAALVHDVLYGLKWKCRLLCDLVYRRILETAGYSRIRKEIEYEAIRLVGWRNWKAVTAEEQHETKRMVSVRWIRTKNVPARIKELLGKAA